MLLNKASFYKIEYEIVNQTTRDRMVKKANIVAVSPDDAVKYVTKVVGPNNIISISSSGDVHAISLPILDQISKKIQPQKEEPKKPEPKKRTVLSEETKKKIGEANKRRWAEKKEQARKERENKQVD